MSRENWGMLTFYNLKRRYRKRENKLGCTQSRWDVDFIRRSFWSTMFISLISKRKKICASFVQKKIVDSSGWSFCSQPTCGGGGGGGGRNYILKWVFLADRYIHHWEVWLVSLKGSPIVEFETEKIFFWILLFFEEISRIEVLCEHGIFGMTLFTFSVTFHQIKIFFIKILIQTCSSCQKKNQFWIPNRRKVIKILVRVS